MRGHEAFADDKPDASQLDAERIDGELEAAIVFAAAAHEAYQYGEDELGNAGLSDAMDGYAKVITALSQRNLSGERKRYLEEKMNHLREQLNQIHTMTVPATGRAAR